MSRTLPLALASLAIVVAACGGTGATAAPATAEPAATMSPSMEPESMAPESMAPESSAPASPSAALQDIVDTATAAGTFGTLLTAATEADLVETLKGEGPYTVFAPTDDAFAALPEGTLEGLLADKEALREVLLYHVVPGAVTSDQVVTLTSADTAAEKPIEIAVVDGEVVLNDSVKVVTTDIQTSNGVIHVIDGVLLPPAE